MDRNFYVPEVTLDLQANAAAMQSDDFDAPHLEVRPEISQRIQDYKRSPKDHLGLYINGATECYPLFAGMVLMENPSPKNG